MLDIGTGTGNLAVLLAAQRCEIWGTDFSEAMLTEARAKLPQARFVRHDLWEVEDYWLADEALTGLRAAGLLADYQQITPCAGVYAIRAAGEPEGGPA